MQCATVSHSKTDLAVYINITQCAETEDGLVWQPLISYQQGTAAVCSYTSAAGLARQLERFVPEAW